mmetsp:Transcript_3702/g.7262  ORF Transcript_3702/g.7262 Transcript_3702/m.7262 type:complete len:245 (+) Transcript_3702:886-1620(+)
MLFVFIFVSVHLGILRVEPPTGHGPAHGHVSDVRGHEAAPVKAHEEEEAHARVHAHVAAPFVAVAVHCFDDPESPRGPQESPCHRGDHSKEHDAKRTWVHLEGCARDAKICSCKGQSVAHGAPHTPEAQKAQNANEGTPVQPHRNEEDRSDHVKGCPSLEGERDHAFRVLRGLPQPQDAQGRPKANTDAQGPHGAPAFDPLEIAVPFARLVAKHVDSMNYAEVQERSHLHAEKKSEEGVPTSPR